jgi:hypothetical protein
MMNAEQLPLLSHGLAPLKLRARVRVIAEGWEGEVAQTWDGRDYYAVWSPTWPGSALGRKVTSPLPIFRRDELEAL